MRYDLNYEYITCYFGNGIYEDGFRNLVSIEEKNYMLNYLFKLNDKMYLCEVNDNNLLFLSNNICFYKKNGHFVLFKTLCRDIDNRIVNELEGIVINDSSDDVVWMYIDNLICFIMSDQFYEYQGSTILSEETLNQIYVENQKLCKGNNNLKYVFDDIGKSECSFPFMFSCIEYGTNQFKFYKSASYDILLLQKEISSIDEIFQKNSFHVNNISRDWIIEMQLPSLSNLTDKQGFIKDRKKIKALKEQGKAICIAHKENDKRNFVEIPFVKEGVLLPFYKIKEIYKQNLR